MSGVRTRLPTRERDLVRMVSFATALYRRSTVLYAEMAKFGIVGATAAIIDLGGAASLHDGVGLMVALGGIAITAYGLGLHSQLSYNIAQFLGTGLATLFRFWAYRKWVFLAPPAPVTAAVEAMDLAIAGQSGPGL